MSDLYIFNKKVDSIFQLLGEKENDISYSVGYTLSTCKHFMQNFLTLLKIKTPFDPDKIKIRLQTHEKEKGFTDFEIIQEGEFHILVEAKRGWNFPTFEQLKKYSDRPSFKNSLAKDKRIIIFNESIPAYTKSHFKSNKIGIIEVEVIPWRTLEKLSISSIKMGRDNENRLLRDLNFYLQKISTMQNVDSNWVYVVSLGRGGPDNWNLTWQEIVNKHKKYFHGVGGNKSGWPAEPPNYIAFRYNGKLQSIHHIDSYQVFTDPSLHFPKVPKQIWGECYLYDLGPAIIPLKEVKAGKKIIRSMRVWAMLDLLLTCDTIQDARDKSHQRDQHSL